MAVADIPAPVSPTPIGGTFRGRALGLDVHSTYDIPGLRGGSPAASTRRTLCYEEPLAELERGWHEQEAEQSVELRLADGRLFMSISRQPELGYRIWAPRHGRHIVSSDGSEIRSVLPRRAPLAWQRLFFAQTLPLAAALRGLEPLHASAVGLRGRAVAFTAASGTGKSSLAAHLVATGATFLTDDVLALESVADDVIAHAGPARAGVSSHELRSLTPAGRRRLGRRVGAADKAYLEPVQGAAALPLAILYRVSRGTRFSELRVHEQVPPQPRAILASSFLRYLSTRERLLNQFAICERITSSVRLFDLEIPSTTSAQAAAAFVLAHSETVLSE